MSAKQIFIDSNILLYLFTDDEHRKRVVESLFVADHIISTQVISENVNVCLRKLHLSKEEAYAHGRNLSNKFQVALISRTSIESAFNVSLKYGFGYWDSLIIPTALENNCTTLYTEDLQNGQVIEGTLHITNPFIQE